MHKIKIGSKTWKFRSSFNDYNLSNIKDYMRIHDEMDKVRNEYMKVYEDITTKKEVQGMEIDIYKFSRVGDLSSLQMKLHLIRISFLSSMCITPDKFQDFALNTAGVDKEIIDTCLDALFTQLGAFNDFWEEVPPIESFKHSKGRFLKTKYKVHDMDKTTLYRETMSYQLAEAAMSHRGKLDLGVWDDICKFVSILVRPSNEVEEISFNKKAFLKGKKIKGLSNTEKLNSYIDKLEEVSNKRAKQFEALPLPIAIGVLKCYFEKKNRSEKNTTEYTRDHLKSQKQKNTNSI